jgi:UDP:flavonoid glycosyltransferase YjiC (YdhE family)
MRIAIFTAGSQGDVQPCILLGRGLQQAGFDVVLAVPQNFADLTQRNGLRFHPLRGDVQQIMASETGRKQMRVLLHTTLPQLSYSPHGFCEPTAVTTAPRSEFH